MNEFELIARHFTGRGAQRKDVLLGIGDDAAMISLPESRALVVTTDTLVEGVHFLPDVSPHALGHKAVAVNLSDLAAMGAEPAWISLAITLPDKRHDWIEAFAASLADTCEYYGVSLIGGDTTRGPLSITITAHGLVKADKALRRSGANPGDWLYVTGTPGDACRGLELLQMPRGEITESCQIREKLEKRLLYPTPRVAAGQALKGLASAAVDISDGLLQDLLHITKASYCDVEVVSEQLPISDALAQSVPESDRLRYQLAGGDDYELLFAVPEENRGSVETALKHFAVPFACIGRFKPGRGEVIVTRGGEPMSELWQGWDPFRDATHD
ncbi:thiamine-phosphate kinase [Corallincola spongiicola]|uniref:Thiamine-monophosphate kinase n=1 Tax=Corallincola spongiicola TaxID=2520508 RepID=A0ABY1WMI9_9GAMM|nr:thiamine-phosphate kinase [Corallincola spongiicola]TAA43629.1 thiamine-phosphate kinase [Corallincola spongiicola]